MSSDIAEVDSRSQLDLDLNIPTIIELKKIMRSHSECLYTSWKHVIANRLVNLEFDGYISKNHIQVHDAVWRLPNDEIRYALCKLEEDFEKLGYDYEFKFDDVDDTHWIMYYSITLPDIVEEDDTPLYPNNIQTNE